MTIRFGIASRPFPGERHCGDAAWVVERVGERLVLVVDALGHGALAAREIDAVASLDWKHWDGGPSAIVRRLHQERMGGRGAAVMACVLRPGAGGWLATLCGVGNIRAGLLGSGATIEGIPGIVGGRVARSLREEELWLPTGAVLAIATDGVSSMMWREPVSRLASLDRLAGQFVSHFGSQRDDASVVVARA